MKLSEFLEKQRAYKSCLNKFGYFILGGIALGATIGFIAAFHKNSDVRNTSALAGGFLGVYAGALVGGFWMKTVRTKLGIFCPGCKTPLIGVLARIAVASGNCGDCGTQILER